jgi:hypothetical protein
VSLEHFGVSMWFIIHCSILNCESRHYGTAGNILFYQQKVFPFNFLIIYCSRKLVRQLSGPRMIKYHKPVKNLKCWNTTSIMSQALVWDFASQSIIKLFLTRHSYYSKVSSLSCF